MLNNKSSFKQIAFIMAIIMILQMILPSVNIWQRSYALEVDDIKTHWAKENIESLKELGIVNGYDDGTFRPDNPITRAEFITIINRAANIEPVEYGDKFTDVKKSDWYANDISAASNSEIGYIKGYVDGTMRPNNFITRFEAAVAISRLLKLDGESEIAFIDKDSMPSWAKEYVGATASAGYFSGYKDNSFRGNEYITRAETSTFVYRSLIDLSSVMIAERNIGIDEIPLGLDIKKEKKKNKISNSISPQITEIDPQSGKVGDIITIKGSNFSATKSENTVTFVGPIQGSLSTSLISATENELKLIVPGVVPETMNVKVNVGSKDSNSVSFTSEKLLDPTPNQKGNETEVIFEDLKELINQTIHELNIALIPAMNNQGLSSEATEVIDELGNLENAVDEIMNNALAGRTDEELAIMDAVFSSEIIKEQLQKIKDSAEILSHSTTGEAIENIEQAADVIETIINMLDEVRTWLKVTLASLVAISVGSIFFDFGATALSLTPIISTIKVIVYEIITPIIIILKTIVAVLSYAPTEVVGNSFGTGNYRNDYKLNQYFGSVKNPVTTGEGIMYVTQPYSFEGGISFTSEGGQADKLKDLSQEFLQSSFIVGSIVTILDGLGAIPDMNIHLEDIEVKIKAISSNPDVISGNWNEDEDRLILTAYKPGEADITIQADIYQVGRSISKESVSITRHMKSISGTQIVGPFSEASIINDVNNIDTVKNGNELVAYIGDKLKIIGEGFSNNSFFQKMFFEPVINYNDTGKSIVNETEFKSFSAIVPDTVSGKFFSKVGDWLSHKEDIRILPPMIEAYPSAIIKESWPVVGRGFSKTKDHNEGNWNGGKSVPMTIPLTYPESHKKLGFKVPESAQSGPFTVTTIGELVSNEVEVAVRKFSDVTRISQINSVSLRPTVAMDSSNGNRIVAWIDQNNKNGNQLVTAIVKSGESEMSDGVIVSQNIGGIITAPGKPKVFAKDGIYYAVWVGTDNDRDQIMFSYSNNGSDWNNEFNISDSQSNSVEPDITVTDIDFDGDNDVFISWTEEATKVNENAVIKVATLENQNNNYTLFKKEEITGSENDSAQSDIESDGTFIAVAFSQEHGVMSESYARDIYVSKTELNYHNINVNFSQPTKITNVRTGLMNQNNWWFDATAMYSVAKHPSIDVDEHGYVYISYEKSYLDFEEKREDIFFKKLSPEGTLTDEINVSNSKMDSQTPELVLDGDTTPTLVWIEQGFTEKNGWGDIVYGRDMSFDSKVIFARSFDEGVTFNQPYVTLDENENGVRIGHLSVAATGHADITMVWQKNEISAPQVDLITTVGEINEINNMPINNVQSEINDYLVRTQSDRTFYNMFRPDPRLARKGDIFISNMDGSNQRRITRNGSIHGKPSLSKDGKKLAYSNDWLYVAEADGSYPIKIWRGDIDLPLDAYFSDSGDYIAFNATGEMYWTMGGVGFVESNGISKGNLFGWADLGAQPWDINDRLISRNLEYVENNGEEVLEGFRITEPSRYENYFLNPDTSNNITGASWSPDGNMIAYTKGSNRRIADHGDEINNSSYDNFGKLVIASKTGKVVKELTTEENAMVPVWSPDGTKIAYIKNENSGNREVYIVDVQGNADSGINISNDDYYAATVEFSPDGNSIIYTAGLIVQNKNEMRLIKVDLDGTNKVYLNAIATSTSRPDAVRVATEGIVNELDFNDVEEGDTISLGFKLKSKPTDDVLLNISTNSNDISIDLNQLEFNQTNWNVYQNIAINGIDDHVVIDERFAQINYGISTNDNEYSKLQVPSQWVVVTDTTQNDTSKPMWDTGSSFTATDITATSLKLNWTDTGIDNKYVNNYIIYLSYDGHSESAIAVIDSGTFEYDVTGLEDDVEYTFRIALADAAGNLSSNDMILPITLSDNESPVWPSNAELTFSNVTETSMLLTWSEATDLNGVANYNIYVDSILKTKVNTGREFLLQDLEPNKNYTIKIEAEDGKGNITNDGPTGVQTTLDDTTNPYWLDAEVFRATDITNNSIKFNWDDAVDNIALGSYKLYLNGNLITTVDKDINEYIMTGLNEFTEYEFYVIAVDGAGNESTNHLSKAIKVATIGSKFNQGIGYDSGKYDLDAVQPTTFNWNRQSRFIGTDYPGMKWKADIDNDENWRYNEQFVGIMPSVIIDKENNIYASFGGYKVGSKYDKNGNALTTFTNKDSSSILIEDSNIITSDRDYMEGQKKSLLNEYWIMDIDSSSSNKRMKSSPAITSDNKIIYSFAPYIYGASLDYIIANSPKVWGDPELADYSEWSMHIGQGIDAMYSSPAIGSDGTIYVGRVGGNLNAFNSDGSYKWHFVTGDSVDSSPAIGSDGTIYIGSDDGKVYAINPDGTKKWEFITEGYMLDGNLIDDVNSSAAIGSDGTIYIGNDGGHLYAINTDGSKKWSYDVPGKIISSPIIDAQGKIYFGDSLGNFYKLNNTGSKIWHFKARAGIASSPAIGSDGTIYFTTVDHNLYALGKPQLNFFKFEYETYEFNEDVGTYEIKVIRDGSDGAERLYYNMNINDPANNASSSQEFTYDSELGYLEFANGETEKTISLTIFNNSQLTGDHVAVLELQDIPQNQYCRTEVTIKDLQVVEKAKIDFESELYSVNEDGRSIELKLIRTGELSGDAQIEIEVLASSTADSNDYSIPFAPHIVYFNDGETEKTFDISIVDDLVDENNEEINLNLKVLPTSVNYTDVEITRTGQSTIQIVDNDDITVTPPVLTGSSDGSAEISVSGISSGDIIVLYGGKDTEIERKTASSDSMIFTNVLFDTDYYAIKITSGITSNNSNFVDVTQGPTKSIIDFENVSYDVEEDLGNLTIKLIRSGKIDKSTKVGIEVLGKSTATETDDFSVLGSKEISFVANETEKTFDIQIIDDIDIESDELINIELIAVRLGKDDVDVDISNARQLEVKILANDAIKIPHLEVDPNNNTTIIVTNGEASGEFRLYYENGGVANQSYNISDPFIIEHLPDGTYYAANIVNGVESDYSNNVSIIVPKVVGFVDGATISLSPGTESGTTKVTINNPGAYSYYSYSMSTYEPGEGPDIDTVYGNVMDYNYTLGPGIVFDNIQANAGEYIRVLQVEGPGGDDKVIGFNSKEVLIGDINNN